MNNQFFAAKQTNDNNFELTPKERATFKRALIQNGQQTAGLSDAELQKRYNALVGEPLHTQAAPIPETVPTPQPKPMPRKTPKTQPAAPQVDKKAQLMAMFDELVAGNDSAPAISEAQIHEMIERQIARTKFVTIPAHVFNGLQRYREDAINELENASFHCADETEHSALFEKFRAYLATLDAHIHPQP
jgi:hypothetical protein